MQFRSTRDIPVVDGLVEGARIAENALRMGQEREHARRGQSEARGERGDARADAGAEVVRTARLVAFETSQPLMSSLKLAHAELQPRLSQEHPFPSPSPQKRYDKSVTRDVSHVPMTPYSSIAVSGEAHHASRATSSAARSAKTCPDFSRRSGLVAFVKPRVERLIGARKNAWVHGHRMRRNSDHRDVSDCVNSW